MSTGSEPLAAPARPGIFSRKATGLVREASVWDVFAYNVNMQNWVIGLLFMLQLIPPLYPGANIYWATVIALIHLWSQTRERSALSEYEVEALATCFRVRGLQHELDGMVHPSLCSCTRCRACA